MQPSKSTVDWYVRTFNTNDINSGTLEGELAIVVAYIAQYACDHFNHIAIVWEKLLLAMQYYS